VTIEVDGRALVVESGMLLAIALMNAGIDTMRRSVGAQGRGPLCGMGICFECRVTIDERPDQRACLEPCRDGLRVRTGG
jgi:sarcosine oxidase subunit alpha